ncbi:MAG: UDP-N-acetylglucosamine 2-epimerase (non-hydrolyzing) [Syntrophaceae bacterium]|nr:UDP-N-acetylglucosamine 2-epimerase (non-hydrolyzing) [Deltaproteobacteria bacterium]
MGARPQFIKLAPVVKAFKDLNLPYKILHTGQHYDYTLSEIQFTALGLEEPHFNLEIGSDSHARQTARMLTGMEEVLVAQKPSLVLVYGDTNSTLAGALCAAKLGLKVGHVEAGVRSYDRKMPEEINRVVADRLSTYHYCPTEGAMNILKSEGIPGILTGDVMYDALLQVPQEALQHPFQRPFVLVTIHRAENTDSPERFGAIWDGLNLVSREVPVVFPVHPRTRHRHLALLGHGTKDLSLIEPVSYLAMIAMIRDAACIITDSGGVQKEAFLLKSPCVTVRDTTEWPETVDAGANLLVEPAAKPILEATLTMMRKKAWVADNPFGDGAASYKIARHIREHCL